MANRLPFKVGDVLVFDAAGCEGSYTALSNMECVVIECPDDKLVMVKLLNEGDRQVAHMAGHDPDSIGAFNWRFKKAGG